MSDPSKLPRRPEARALSVEDLVDKVLRGEVRIPEFQRPLRWTGRDVRALLDSMWRGYPVGSLLMWKHKAEAAPDWTVGPLTVDAPALDEAWWVVDGQQRLVALAASLGLDEHAPPDETYDVWFDTDGRSTDGEERRFVGRSRGQVVPGTWVPLRVMLDASRLQDWLFEWVHGRDAERRRLVLDAGSRIRSYQIPVYVIDVDDDRILREVFRRVNRSGHPLTEPEVFDALFARSPKRHGLSELADRASEIGWGRIEPDKLLQAILAMAGRDVTRRLDQLDLDDEDIGPIFTEALPPIVRAIEFLRDEAEIPHLRALPYATPIVFLPAFFHRFPDPSSRVLVNLVRWVWRGMFVGNIAQSPVRRAHAAALSEAPDAEQAAMALLRLVTDRTAPPRWTVPARFDGRDAQTRIAVLGMASLGPRHVEDGARLDVPSLLARYGTGAYRTVLGGAGRAGVGHRLLHPPAPHLTRRLRERLQANAPFDDVLASHGFVPPAGGPAPLDDADWFRIREQAIESAVERLVSRLAAWDRPDRPSIDYLAGEEGEE